MDISIDLERVDTFDILIRKLIDCQIDADLFAAQILPFPDPTLIQLSSQSNAETSNLLHQFRQPEHRRQFIFYFLFKLHSACSWIVFGLNLVSGTGSQSCSPVKASDSENSASTAFEIKKNLFGRRPSPNQSTTQRSFDKPSLNLGDQDSFPCLQSTPKPTSNEPSIKKRPTRNPPSDDNTTTFANVRQNNSDSKRNRRIKPTALRSTELSSRAEHRAQNRQLFEQSPLIESSERSARVDRQQLKSDLLNLTPVKSSRSELLDKIVTPLKNLDIVSPCIVSRDRMTTGLDLCNLVRFYTKLIAQNVSINLLGECEFLVHLVSRRVTADRFEQQSPFEFSANYHDCVLFAALCIQKLIQMSTLDHIGFAFFKNLASNENIQNVLPELHKELVQRTTDNTEAPDSTILMPPPDFVAFQPETDSKENFPHDQSFHAFRKQRDAFFKLYYEWKLLYEKNGFRSDTLHTNAEFKFATKIHHIFSLGKEFGNLYHLSRLFIAHLSQCCIGWSELTGKSATEKPVAVVAPDSSIFPDTNKLKKLNQRFNFQDQKAMATQSTFVGEEQFFLQFILTCNHYCFLTVLRTLMIEKIGELNDPALLIETLELDQNDSEASALFSNCSLHSQLIGKFFGVLLFVPFYSKAIRFPNFVKKLESLKYSQPNDSSLSGQLNTYIANSIKFGHMILTIPWILQLISQMDNDSHMFCNYESTLDSLVTIYHQLGRPDLDYPIHSINRFYLNLALGTFFERCRSLLSGRLLRPDLIECNILRGKYSRDGLDERCRVHVRFLNESFPRLVALKDSLRVGQQLASDCRKITPLSLSNQMNSTVMDVSGKSANLNASCAFDNREQRFQLAFEENFFRLHSQSLRKTVDFIAERLHSKCIKQMKHDFIKPMKRDTIADHTDLSLSSVILNEIKGKCFKHIDSFISNHVPHLFALLISQVDYDMTVRDVAQKICTRITREKCYKWIQTNLNDNWMLNELLLESKRRSVAINRERETNQETQLNTSKKSSPLICPSSQLKPIPNIGPSFNQVRDLICDLYFDTNKPVTSEEVIEIIDQLRSVRLDDVLQIKTLGCIDTTILDLLVCLIVNRPAVLDDSLLHTFTLYWSQQKLIVQKLISPRNLYILSICRDPYSSWNKFESIVTRLIRCFAYPPSSIESDLLWSLSNKQEWNDKVLLKLGSVLKSIAESCKSFAEYKDSAEIVELIDWFSWFCAQQDLTE